MISFLVWPFVLQCASFPFLFCVFFVVSLMGALMKWNLVFLSLEAILFFTVLSFEWSRCFGPRGTRFPFWWVLSFRWSRCFWPRGRFIFYGVLYFLRCSPLGEVDVLDLEALVSPFDGCSHLSEVVVVDLEAYLFFTVLSFWWNRCFGPRGTSFVSLMVGALIKVKSVLWTSRQIYFLRCSPLKRIVVFESWGPVSVDAAVGRLKVLHWHRWKHWQKAGLVSSSLHHFSLCYLLYQSWITLSHPDSGHFLVFADVTWNFFLFRSQKFVIPM